MLDFLDIFRRGELMAPHGYCLLWQPELIWTHVAADSLIAAAYFSIPLALVRFVTRRKDIQFSWIFWLFALFIVACGTTHLVSIWNLWHGDYGFEALIKVITALASVTTAIVLWPLIPKALALPSPLQLQQANEALGARIEERDLALAQLTAEIGEREQAEAALLQAQKMEAVGQLTGGIAHDFNNLLQSVTGMLALIARKPGEADKVRTWAEHGLAAAERGAKLTGQLLAFSRVQKLDLKPVRVAPTIEAMTGLLTRTLGPQIAIETDLRDGGAAAMADDTQLELALLNLAINARDAMPQGGRLTIATATIEADGEAFPDGAVEIRVSDDGIGMTSEVLARAFEPFYTTKGVGKGTGLGLSMVYGVARQSGGTARIESAPGKGTTITIRLRRAPAEALADGEGEEAEKLPAGNGESVLIVDDDADVRATLRHALESLGYEVREAQDGASALASIEETPPALAILDYAMPGMTGAELARAAAHWPEVKIVFATGYADTKAIERALGDAPVLRKPFRIGALARLVAETLQS